MKTQMIPVGASLSHESRRQNIGETGVQIQRLSKTDKEKAPIILKISICKNSNTHYNKLLHLLIKRTCSNLDHRTEKMSTNPIIAIQLQLVECLPHRNHEGP